MPRLRRSTIARIQLLKRLASAAADFPVIAIVAPAGYGKTTLLAQLAHDTAAPARVVWYAADTADHDVVRCFAALVDALAPLELHWRVAPTELVANMEATARHARAAAGELAAALESAPGARTLVLLDDLHLAAASAEVAVLLEALVERLPEHVTLVLSSRVPLPLPMARWVVSGEAREFGARDLQFSEQDACALAESLGVFTGADRRAENALQVAERWPAGVALVLRAEADGDPIATGRGSRQLLFEYLAAEVLHRLPEELQQFLLDVSILAELTPELCGAVTGRPDARAMLRSLYRQDLFVTAVDGAASVLRLHDLFREFLRSRLSATDPERVLALHERAARAESSLSRAIGHYLAAGRWQGALQLLARHSDVLREHGHQPSMQRWLEQIPVEAVDESEEGLQVRACCAWLRWDWLQSRADMSRLIERMQASGREPPTQALLSLMGFVSALGERDEASRIAEEVGRRPLARKDRAVLALRRAWAAMDVGDLPVVETSFGEFVAAAAEDPREIAPLIVDRASLYIGLPGMLTQYDRFLAIGRTAMQSDGAPWHCAYRTVEGWVALWRGQRDAAALAIDTARELQSRLGGVTPTEDALVRLESVHLAATGERAGAVRLARTLVDRFDSPRYSSIRIVFERAYWAGLGKVAWMSGDTESVREAARRMVPPRQPQEWYFIDLVRHTLQAQVAILERRWDEAARQLAGARDLHRRLRFPQGHSDPRVLAAFVHCMQGARERAWQELEPVMEECLADDAIGPLLCEPRAVADVVRDVIPASRRADPHLRALLQRLDAWSLRTDGVGASGPLMRLSERERTVLARVALGDGNKDIARRLDLSLHTVKRHVANILGKLDCISRQQAADLYRQHGG